MSTKRMKVVFIVGIVLAGAGAVNAADDPQSSKSVGDQAKELGQTIKQDAKEVGEAVAKEAKKVAVEAKNGAKEVQATVRHKLKPSESKKSDNSASADAEKPK